MVTLLLRHNNLLLDNRRRLLRNNYWLLILCLAILLAFKFGPSALGLPKPFQILSNLAPLALVVITVPIVAAVGTELDKWGLDAPTKQCNQCFTTAARERHGRDTYIGHFV